MTRILTAVVLVLGLAQPALAERVALLIGNADYQQPGLALQNPLNDVAALELALRDIGFDVIAVTDQDRAGMLAALEDLGLRAADAQVAMVFFAGHGVQVDGENWLIGQDFSSTDPAALAHAAVSLSEVRAVLAAAAPDIGIVILDACRDNPLSASGVVQPGLARTRGGAGLLVAYATDPGNVALDGRGDTSPFAAALVRHIAAPGVDVRVMLGRVRQQVVLETRGAQVPWVEDSALGEHYLGGPGDTQVAGAQNVREMQRWREISAQTDIAVFEEYVLEFPEGVFRQFAADRITMLRQARAAGTPAGQSSDKIIATADDPGQVGVALASLGYLQATRSLEQVGANDLSIAFDLWRANLPNPDEATLDRLFLDAARMTMVLAAATAQELRTDIVALDSIDRIRQFSQGALDEIAAIAETNPEAAPVLAQASADQAAIEAALRHVMARLDNSRLYYQRLIDQAHAGFAGYLDPALLEAGAQGAGGQARTEQRLLRDAALFARHVADVTPETEGTYSWLTDFLPES